MPASAVRLWGAGQGHLGDVHSELTVGADVRHDDIGTVGLYRTRERQRLSTTRQDEVEQTSGAVYAQIASRWTGALRTVFGLRGDLYSFDVRSSDPVNSGSTSDGIVNPKFSVVVGPWARTEVYFNAGGGFHSNDGRGATIRRDPASGDPVDPVDPLVRAKGVEAGLRTLAVKNLHTSAAIWGL